MVGLERPRGDGQGRRAAGALYKAARGRPLLYSDLARNQPFEVLRDIIRSKQYFSVGGPPQHVKVYEHMNTLPFALYWPDKISGKVVALGRPLMDYEISSLPVLDPDDIHFRPNDAAIHVQFR